MPAARSLAGQYCTPAKIHAPELPQTCLCMVGERRTAGSLLRLKWA
jgi:hypothetical protein